MTDAARSSMMLSAMTECAYRLGMAFGAEAERAEAHAQRLEFYNLFDRCFFSVRVAIGLELRLKRDQPVLRPLPGREVLRERADASDQDRDTTRLPVERDRDREVERASVPLFLKTLQGIAADAAKLPGPPPGALLSLNDLLAQVSATSVPSTAKPTVGLRARLAGSTTVQTLTRPQQPPPRCHPGFGNAKDRDP